MFKNKKILPVVKLKHLDLMIAATPDYKEIMTQVVGYKNNWFTRKFNFIKQFKLAFFVTNQLRQVDPTKLTLAEDCPIKTPVNIDFITFQAMMELQALLGEKADPDKMLQVITQSIAIACFEVNHDGEYKSDSQEFEKFKKQILNHSFIQMFGLYNWIVEQVQQSVDLWNERFFSVEIADPDYQQAGGSRMNQFNVINTIKAICNDFNITETAAWQMSYNMVQTNSYSKATQSHIQDNMRQIKEARMQASRNQQ